jgi:hypothetical protein
MMLLMTSMKRNAGRRQCQRIPLPWRYNNLTSICQNSASLITIGEPASGDSGGGTTPIVDIEDSSEHADEVSELTDEVS